MEVFAVGFGPELVGIDDRHGTRWKLCALPLGGYVKFHGDADVTSTSAKDDDAPPPARFILRQVGGEALGHRVRGSVRQPPARSGDLRRLLYRRRPALHTGWRSAPCARAALPISPGLQPGDRLVELNGSRVERFEELDFTLLQSVGEPLTLAVERGGELLEFTVRPEIIEVLDAFDRPQQLGDIGVRPFTPASVSQVVAGSPAERGGLQAGDSIVRIGDVTIESFDHLRTIVERNAGVPLTFVVERSGRRGDADRHPGRRERDGADRCLPRAADGVPQSWSR